MSDSDWGSWDSNETGQENNNTSVGQDDWGTWGDSNQETNSNKDDWGTWGDSNQETNNNKDDWGSWESSTEQSNTWESNSSNTQNTDDWTNFNSSQDSNNFVTNEDNTDEYWRNQENFNAQNQPERANLPQVQFGSKKIAVILAGAFIGLALLLVVLNSIRVKKNDTIAIQQQEHPGVSTNSDVSFITIPSNISLSYTGDVQTTAGKIKDKIKYKVNNQVIYCLQIKVQDNSIWSYYCGYNAFSSVDIGDTVAVDYQEPQDGYISISSVSK